MYISGLGEVSVIRGDVPPLGECWQVSVTGGVRVKTPRTYRVRRARWGFSVENVHSGRALDPDGATARMIVSAIERSR